MASSSKAIIQSKVRRVWTTHFGAKISEMSKIAADFTFVALEVKFPSVLHHPAPGNLPGRTYRTLRANVNSLPLIKIAFSFSNAKGDRPTAPTPSTWDFTFREFGIARDPHDPSATNPLAQFPVDEFCFFDQEFYAFSQTGLRVVQKIVQFRKALWESELFANKSVTWVTFQGNFALGYLVKMLSGADLPETLDAFKILVGQLFPVFYDIEHLALFHGIRSKGVVDNVFLPFDLHRPQPSRLDGFDGLVIIQCFIKMTDRYIHGGVERFQGVFFDLVE